MVGTNYDRAFYQRQMNGSVRSAEAVIPMVLNLVPARSVCDVGCGAGTWLSVFLKRGITDIMGLDGDYVPREYLHIPASRFHPSDLRQPIRLGRSFDLAVCLEVAEHLPSSSAVTFVRNLVQMAPVVLFSAAIPNQGGKDHINEQWPDYWEALFRREGYVSVDALRPKIWDNDAVEWWYRQNIFLYVRESDISKYPALESAHKEMSMPRRVVHPIMFDRMLHRPNRVIGLVRTLMRTIKAKPHRFRAREDGPPYARVASTLRDGPV